MVRFSPNKSTWAIIPGKIFGLISDFENVALLLFPYHSPPEKKQITALNNTLNSLAVKLK
jgi:hypothetical protein